MSHPPSPPSADVDQPAADEPEADELICHCFGVHRSEIIQAILAHQPTNVPHLTGVCQAGNGCMSCWADLDDLLRQYRSGT